MEHWKPLHHRGRITCLPSPAGASEVGSGRLEASGHNDPSVFHASPELQFEPHLERDSHQPHLTTACRLVWAQRGIPASATAGSVFALSSAALRHPLAVIRCQHEAVLQHHPSTRDVQRSCRHQSRHVTTSHVELHQTLIDLLVQRDLNKAAMILWHQ